MFRKNKFSTCIFVTASLCVFAIMGLFYISLNGNYYSFKPQEADGLELYLNNYNEGDPLITRRLKLENLLAGPIIAGLDPMMGNNKASIMIVEYSDFTCSFCRDQEIILKNIFNEYEEQIRLVWKDYPESDEDSMSFMAAIAARCADKQGAFWPFHDLLFKNSKNLNDGVFLQIAKDIKLDIKDFSICLNDKSTKELVRDNIIEANMLELPGVPFIYINQQEIFGQLSYEDLKRIVEVELGR